MCVAPGLMSARLANIDEQYQSTFPMAGNWTSVLKDTVGKILHVFHVYTALVQECSFHFLDLR